MDSGSFKSPNVFDDDDDDLYVPSTPDKEKRKDFYNDTSTRTSSGSSPSLTTNDPACSITGLYRILEVITDQGSGGLVDKIIISQNSLKAFINTVCPGAYASMTKVNFKSLDQYVIKPVGIYGSKEEIVRFLQELGVVDDAVAAQLLLADPSTPGQAQRVLRSGLYILRHAEQQNNAEQIFVIYWPEESTWDDSAPSQVCRNRVTLMRYLSKMCDQIVALMSSKHSQSIVWNGGEDGDDDSSDEGDEESRIMKCVVDRTTEQEESVQVREGFKVHSEHISLSKSTTDRIDQAQTKPMLLYGETTQGFMTVQAEPAKRVPDIYNGSSFTSLQLEKYLASDHLCINESLADQALKILINKGLRNRFPTECSNWINESKAVEVQCRQKQSEALRKAKEKMYKEEKGLSMAVHVAVVDESLRFYPFLTKQSFANSEETDTPVVPFQEIVSIYPEAGDHFQRNKDQLAKISDPEFRNIKDQLCLFVKFTSRAKDLDGRLRSVVAETAALGGYKVAKGAMESAWKGTQPLIQGLMDTVNAIASLLGTADDKASLAQRALQTLQEADREARNITDSKFFSEIIGLDIIKRNEKLGPLVQRAKELAHKSLMVAVPRLVTKLVGLIKKVQEDVCSATVKAEAVSNKDREQLKLRLQLIRHVNGSITQTQHPHTLRIDSVEEEKGQPYNYRGYTPSFKVRGARETQEDRLTLFTIRIMNLTEQDKQDLQQNPSTIPSPRFHSEYKFRMPQGYTVIHAQLLPSDKLLFIVDDHLGNLLVYLESLIAIEGAISRRRGKVLKRERIGQDFVLAFDESKRMLSVVSSDKLFLQIYVYDDGTRGFQARGSSIELNDWYNKGETIRHVCFVSGSEELLLVDSQNQARIYSLVTMQFRPATLSLHGIPSSVHSTPDGSCLLVSSKHGAELTLTAYHYDSFGSKEGVEIKIPNFPVGESFVVTSLISKTTIHLLWLDFSARNCQSYALDITCRTTAYTFRENPGRGSSNKTTRASVHNCLVDCHREVWTRFPVLAAVQREAISSASCRSQKTLVFVTDRNFDRFAPHFSNMIRTFKRTTKKPTGDVLKSIKVSAASFAVFTRKLYGAKQWNVSQYRAGEWVVDFLCMIPIHIAVTKENCFVPLKDGVYSPELEKSLLGAEVNRIVDSISFGWYESLFQSYMATKPVRVISSMGEQSIGKSYALNHFVDTSFAGSAMRTTEGVWMSVTPTEKELVVALDFEGVHSIERSAQEDALLVLFNTAISNLVLFRNNFVLGRDITKSFQSFQSSANVLDPEANPSLFQSTLAIIIKDVSPADTAEIKKEFSLKFSRIVQAEQETNFITHLHNSKMSIIPWPLFESKTFYSLFSTMKDDLDQQVITHPAASEFLHTMKTLMAKIKANDWGAMSQTLASHRVQLLSRLLHNALAFGFQEIDPEREPLKNLDTDVPVELHDTEAQFFLTVGAAPQADAREQALSTLQSSWNQRETRQRIPDAEWTEGLSRYLEDTTNLRIDRVREWLKQNLSRFQEGHGSIEELWRTFEGAIVDLKSNVQLCKLHCANCQLLCIQSRFHNGPHTCQTDHLCIHKCEICEEPREQCGMTADHAGKHICVVTAHLCGKLCKFEGKLGCLHGCVKVVDHVDEHLCPVDVHACGELCSLSSVKLFDGGMYSCPEPCRISCDVAHDRHQCKSSKCPITCQLCKSFCSHQDHMHGLEDGEIHLCGVEHRCPKKCDVGICKIETEPHSVEETFTGKHETFQYTKYSQVDNKLKCVKMIPRGATEHNGSHTHSLDENAFHYCETRCKNCGYYCTLPFGHPQPEHETSHGSMSRTRWTIDGPDDTVLEVEGRRFSTNDGGAPMMCNLLCRALDRHVHIDYCRFDGEAACTGNDETQHIDKRLLPDPDRPKDYVTHNLFWKRSGFKDPYSREEQAKFAKCDAMCSGPEHAVGTGTDPQPSYCTLPMFHPPSNPSVAPALGYISNDGHHFNCRNPVVMQQAYHVIFVADRSASMYINDRRPLPNTPASARIVAASDDRFGAVLSSLFSFWSARATAIGSGGNAARRDAYSVILFNHGVLTAIENDFTSTPDQLLEALLPYEADGRTNFTAAITHAQGVMDRNWSTERSPVIIFLSDGECHIADQTMQELCRRSIQLGKALSFHSVSFGPDAASLYLRRMADIAQGAQNNAPRDPLSPPAATVRSTFHKALDTVQLAETFLGIAESLRKPRGALMH